MTKTSELTGAALDWAVAKCENYEGWNPEKDFKLWSALSYSTDWAQGGPIIERERIQLRPMRGNEWDAYWGLPKEGRGPTPLIAAMRCYIASKLGDTVEIPKELT